jgi:hypothetical protein
MFNPYAVPVPRGKLLAGVLAGSILVSPVRAQPATSVVKPETVEVAATGTPPVAPAHSRYRPNRFSRRATLNYGLVWGVDSLSVKWTESGEVIRFSYRVLDGDKAGALNDKKSEPSLIDPQVGVKLVVPALENVGLLRQTPSGKPEPGKVYWMAFSNKGRLVKRGDHVNVVIGRFHGDGLVVE